MMISMDDIFSEFEGVRQRMERTWQQMLGPPGSPRFRRPVIEPPADVYETAESVVVLVEIAGINNQELEISVEGTTLIIRGQREDRQRHPRRLYTQMEICCGPFERTLSLPAEVDPSKATATYDDGFLEIILPKVKRQVNRYVRITIHGA
jgi:HSP20 family protein